jgi:hypothetical protein
MSAEWILRGIAAEGEREGTRPSFTVISYGFWGVILHTVIFQSFWMEPSFTICPGIEHWDLPEVLKYTAIFSSPEEEHHALSIFRVGERHLSLSSFRAWGRGGGFKQVFLCGTWSGNQYGRRNRPATDQALEMCMPEAAELLKMCMPEATELLAVLLKPIFRSVHWTILTWIWWVGSRTWQLVNYPLLTLINPPAVGWSCPMICQTSSLCFWKRWTAAWYRPFPPFSPCEKKLLQKLAT